MVMLLFLVGRTLYVHGMTGNGTGNGSVPGKWKSLAVHFRFHADSVTEPHTVTLLAESHMVGAEPPFRSTGSEEASQLLLRQHMADPATLGVGMGIDGAIYRLGSGTHRSRK